MTDLRPTSLEARLQAARSAPWRTVASASSRAPGRGDDASDPARDDATLEAPFEPVPAPSPQSVPAPPPPGVPVPPREPDPLDEAMWDGITSVGEDPSDASGDDALWEGEDPEADELPWADVPGPRGEVDPLDEPVGDEEGGGEAHPVVPDAPWADPFDEE